MDTAKFDALARKVDTIGTRRGFLAVAGAAAAMAVARVTAFAGCKANGEQCRYDGIDHHDSCCSGYCGSNGTCDCISNGTTCERSDQCCDDNVCVNGRCQNHCGELGSTCDMDACCCDGVCKNGKCKPSDPCEGKQCKCGCQDGQCKPCGDPCEGMNCKCGCEDGVCKPCGDPCEGKQCKCGCENGKCKPCVCVPNCNGRTCGPDGCGGSCGTCRAGQKCQLKTGRCKKGKHCDCPKGHPKKAPCHSDQCPNGHICKFKKKWKKGKNKDGRLCKPGSL